MGGQLTSRLCRPVNADHTLSEREAERMVQHEIGSWVSESVEIPVWMSSQHNWRLMIDCFCRQFRGPSICGNGMRYFAQDQTWEPHRRVSFIADRERDARVRDFGDVPGAAGPAIETAMQCSIPVVRFGEVASAVELVRVVCDAVCVAAWDGAVVGMVGVDGVECSVVVA